MAKRSNNYRLVGNVSADGKDHQSGYVVDRGASCLHRTQDNGKVLSKSFVSGKLIIKGVIGNTPRQNRDNMRVFDRRGGNSLPEIPYKQRTNNGYQRVR